VHDGLVRKAHTQPAEQKENSLLCHRMIHSTSQLTFVGLRSYFYVVGMTDLRLRSAVQRPASSSKKCQSPQQKSPFELETRVDSFDCETKMFDLHEPGRGLTRNLYYK